VVLAEVMLYIRSQVLQLSYHWFSLLPQLIVTTVGQRS